MQMNIDDIKISDQFLDSHPSQEKMERFEKYWLRTNHQDKPIILDTTVDRLQFQVMNSGFVISLHKITMDMTENNILLWKH